MPVPVCLSGPCRAPPRRRCSSARPHHRLPGPYRSSGRATPRCSPSFEVYLMISLVPSLRLALPRLTAPQRIVSPYLAASRLSTTSIATPVATRTCILRSDSRFSSSYPGRLPCYSSRYTRNPSSVTPRSLVSIFREICPWLMPARGSEMLETMLAVDVDFSGPFGTGVYPYDFSGEFNSTGPKMLFV